MSPTITSLGTVAAWSGTASYEPEQAGTTGRPANRYWAFAASSTRCSPGVGRSKAKGSRKSRGRHHGRSRSRRSRVVPARLASRRRCSARLPEAARHRERALRLRTFAGRADDAGSRRPAVPAPRRSPPVAAAATGIAAVAALAAVTPRGRSPQAPRSARRFEIRPTARSGPDNQSRLVGLPDGKSIAYVDGGKPVRSLARASRSPSRRPPCRRSFFVPDSAVIGYAPGGLWKPGEAGAAIADIRRSDGGTMLVP
jgi:hypothetical protein